MPCKNVKPPKDPAETIVDNEKPKLDPNPSEPPKPNPILTCGGPYAEIGTCVPNDPRPSPSPTPPEPPPLMATTPSSQPPAGRQPSHLTTGGYHARSSAGP